MSYFQAFVVAALLLGAHPSDPPTDLRLTAIFAPPGPRGLEYSALARSLDGHRVRIAGYKVRRDPPTAGAFLLAPVPVQIHDEEYGLADDLPAATVLVEGPGLAHRPLPETPRRLELTGVLRLGPRAEPDGRISFARLVIDALPSDPSNH